MAAGCQLLFVCAFTGGIVVRLYNDIANDSAGSPELAHRFLGLQSSDEAVIVMILVAFGMVFLLIAALGGEMYAHAVEEHLKNKWSVCTMDPPHVQWRTR
eukprot:6192013-Prymnesium_polylepis.1